MTYSENAGLKEQVLGICCSIDFLLVDWKLTRGEREKSIKEKKFALVAKFFAVSCI